MFKVPEIERKDDEFDVGVSEENVAKAGAENHLFMTGVFNSRTSSKDTFVLAMFGNETPRKLEEDEILEIS